MYKSFLCLIVASFMMILCLGCNQQSDSAPSEVQNATQPSSKTLTTSAIAQSSLPTSSAEDILTEPEAVEYVKDKVNDKIDDMIYEIDNLSGVDSKQYYVIRAYRLVKLDNEISQGFTYGWYKLDKYTKDLYKQDLASTEDKWDKIDELK